MIKSFRSGGTQHRAEIMRFIESYLVAVGGVLNRNSTNLKVTQQVTPAMTVLVKQGRGLIPQSNGLQAFPFLIDTTDEVVTIASNGSGNPRIDAIVAYIDMLATPNSGVTNVGKLARVAGAPGASPESPDDSAIASDIGVANPFIRLADVRVNSGVTEIADDKITDKRQDAQLKLYNPKLVGNTQDWVSLIDGASIEVDLSKGNKFDVTIAGNRTFTLENGEAGKTFEIRIKQDGTGSRTWTFDFNPYTITPQDGILPIPTPTANKADKLGFEILGDNATIDLTVISLGH